MESEQYDLIVQKHAKGILEKNKQKFINAILGYILSPQVIIGQGWSITYEQFDNEVGQLKAQYCTDSRIFPKKYFDTTSSGTPPEDALYIKKIQNIEYDEAIQKAHHNYVAAGSTISDEFSSGTLAKRLKDYEKDVLDTFQTMYRKALRNCPNDVIKGSQDFYDDCSLSQSPTFSGYESPPSSFKNGIIHMNMDDENKDMKWRIKS